MITTNTVIQDKVRPGVYINIKSNGNNNILSMSKGVVLMPLDLKFGADNQFIYINNLADINSKLGGINFKTQPIVEALKNASTVIVYKINGGVSSQFSVSDDFIIRSKMSGENGNFISVTVDEVINENKFKITTFYKNSKVCQDIVGDVDYYENDYIEYTGKIVRSSGMFLTGGITAEATLENYLTFLNNAEKIDFNVLSVPTNSEIVKSTMVNFIKRMRETEGKKVVLVLPFVENADYEGII
ncbi:MAG: phage tail sheath subtilisin-like domain-containing protein, partial [Oscillospiraceae bacterium]